MAVNEELMFVALGKDVREGARNVLMWAMHISRGRKLCILHVHQSAQMIPMMGTKVSINLLEEVKVKAYRENERQEMHKILDKYIQACEQAGVQAVKIWIEMESVEKGIVHLIAEHDIKYLVMGAAANKFYSRTMNELKSKKAIYVHREAPDSCHIWFTCKGNLINTRFTLVHDTSCGKDLQLRTGYKGLGWCMTLVVCSVIVMTILSMCFLSVTKQRLFGRKS